MQNAYMLVDRHGNPIEGAPFYDSREAAKRDRVVDAEFVVKSAQHPHYAQAYHRGFASSDINQDPWQGNPLMGHFSRNYMRGCFDRANADALRAEAARAAAARDNDEPVKGYIPRTTTVTITVIITAANAASE